jgi:hypothetical protein
MIRKAPPTISDVNAAFPCVSFSELLIRLLPAFSLAEEYQVNKNA